MTAKDDHIKLGARDARPEERVPLSPPIRGAAPRFHLVIPLHRLNTRGFPQRLLNMSRQPLSQDGVEEVHQGGELRAQPLHRVQHGLTRDGVETIAEVDFEDGEALLPQRPERVAERLGPALGQAGLQRLQLARRRARRPRAPAASARPA